MNFFSSSVPISCLVFLCLLPGNRRINLCMCGVYHQSRLQALGADEKQQSWVLISTAARTAEGWEKPSLIFALWGWIMHLPVEKSLEVTATWRPASEHFLPGTKPITVTDVLNGAVVEKQDGWKDTLWHSPYKQSPVILLEGSVLRIYIFKFLRCHLLVF